VISVAQDDDFYTLFLLGFDGSVYLRDERAGAVVVGYIFFF